MATTKGDRVIVYPGSFDPVTLGHLDLLQRTVKLFDRVIIAIAHGTKPTMFSMPERIALMKQVLQERKLESLTRVESFDCLLVDFMRANHARFLLRGLRTVTDFEFEFQLARANRLMYPETETVFLMPDEGLSFISSSLVREIATLRGNLSSFVPPCVEEALKKKVAATRKNQTVS